MHNAGDTKRTRADSPSIPSRRAMLGGSTAALLAGAALATVARVAPVAAAVADGDDAELLRLHRALVAQGDVIDRIEAEEDRHEITPQSIEQEQRMADADDVWWRLTEQIRDTPACTAAGLRAKAGAMLIMLERIVCSNIGDTLADIATGEVGDQEDGLSLSLARDVLAFAGRVSA